MKRYILKHPCLVEDLREAAALLRYHRPAEDIQYTTIASSLDRYAGELADFDKATGWADPFAEEVSFLMECDHAFSSWKKWQSELFAYARKHDRQVFSREQIDQLCDVLDKMAEEYRNSEKVHRPDWKFCKQYGSRPSIGIGYGCAIAFTPIRGYFNFPLW